MNLLEYILSLIFSKPTPKILPTVTPIPHLLNKQQIIDAMRKSKNLSDESKKLLDNINLLSLRLYISSVSIADDSIIITTSENGDTRYNYISENYLSLSVNHYFPNIKSALGDMKYVVIDNVKLPFSNSIANLSDGLLIINDIYIETIEKLPETFYMIEKSL
jgi:hypothetical protein